MSTKLIIFICAVFLYAVILALYATLIIKAKKNLPDSSTVKKPGSSFWWVFIVALCIIILPVLIPMDTILIVVICGCGVMGEYIVLRDRLEEIKKSIERESPGCDLPPENE